MIYSLYVASLQKENEILSFEASQDTFNDLQKNILKNNFETITPLNLAISNIEDLEIEFKESKNDWESSIKTTNFDVLKKTKVKTITMDSYLESNDKNFSEFNIVIKLDIEGYEMNAIKGAYNLIKKHSPLFIIEFSKFISEEDYDFLRKFLIQHDYTVYDPFYKEINLDIVFKRLKELPKNMFGIGNNFLIKKNSNFEYTIKNLINS